MLRLFDENLLEAAYCVLSAHEFENQNEIKNEVQVRKNV